MFFSIFAEFGDPSRRFCHCVAPNHVFYKGFGIAWHQTVLFTMVLAFHWTHFWCSWTKYRHFVETICAFIFVYSPLSSLFRFLEFCSSSKVLPPWSGRKNDFLRIQTYTFYYCFFRPVRSQILCHLPRALKFSKRLIILCKNMGKSMWHWKSMQKPNKQRTKKWKTCKKHVQKHTNTQKLTQKHVQKHKTRPKKCV